MRFLAVLFVLASAVAVKAQDLSEFDKKAPLSEVKTEVFVKDLTASDAEERKVYLVTRFYGVDGELISQSSEQGVFTNTSTYVTEKDKNGRVIKRTENSVVTIGTEKATPLPRVWRYDYDATGAAQVVCREAVEDENEMPIVESWKLDPAGRVLYYSYSLGEVESFHIVFDRSKDGRLLSETDSSEGEVYRKVVYGYRDDGTLKDSEETIFALDWISKKQYDSIGLEISGVMLEKDGTTKERWTIERDADVSDPTHPKDTFTCKIYEGDSDKMVMQFRRVTVTNLSK